MYVSDEHRFYRKARRKFSFKTYGLLFLWLILALIQWIVIAIIEDARTTFRLFYYICFVTFALAIVIFVIFIFVEKLRFMKGLNFIMALIIVELQIISTFALVAVSWWADVLTFFAVALILVAIFLLIGVFLPAKMDLTLDIAILFIIAFIFLIVASFVLLFELLVWRTSPYSYLVVELSVTITILVFVMYHAQTINGNRFAEMRLNDFFLGSLILFHDFLIIFWLTFYWQISFRLITPDSWIETSTPYDYYLTLNDTDHEAKNLDNSFYRMTQYNWFTRPYDDEYDEIPSDRGKEGNRRGYDSRDHNEENPMARRWPNSKEFPTDWSVYNQRRKNGFRTRGRSRTKGPEQNDIYHAHRNPDDWDPEYITHGADKDVLFDDRFGEKTKDRSGESYDREHQPPKEDLGPRMEESDKDLHSDVRLDVRLDDHTKDRSKESIDNEYQTPNWDIEPIMKDGDAKGKSTAGLYNPTIDFPLADYQPNDKPTMDPTNDIPTSRGSPNIYVVPKATPIGNRVQNPYLLGYDQQSNIQSDNLELNSTPQQNEITGSGFKDRDFNLQGDEMQGQQFSARKPYFNSEITPVWEELSNDEMSRISKEQIPEDKDRWVEPLITREPYPINLPDYEKLVMNGSASISSISS
ncbi:hypothetical protein KR084_005625 [Drosophila pseudotakahashii]|nr:hypothetical protein KR084_005625 [Drosophila pseudotakahashii]